MQAFVEKYLPEAEQMEMPSSLCTGYPEKKTVLLIPDVECDYPLYPRIFHQYFGQDRPNTELLIYLPEEYSTDEIVYAIEGILKQYEAWSALGYAGRAFSFSLIISEKQSISYIDNEKLCCQKNSVH